MKGTYPCTAASLAVALWLQSTPPAGRVAELESLFRLCTVKQHWNGADYGIIDAEMSDEPMPTGCERIVDSGLGRFITMEK
jgi:hypothetical protein